jgi:hypothetical protein
MSVQFVLIAATLFFSSILQGAVGFAFGLFAVPMLVWSGLPLSEAVVITSISIFFQVLVGTFQLRAYIRWREVLPATVIRYMTVPVGIGLLLVIDTLNQSQIKQILGGLLLLVIFSQIFLKVKPQQQLHPKWMLLAFSSSGLMQGVAAMGGPPAVLWVMAHQWTNQQTRAFLLTLFLLVAPMQLTLLYLMAPTDITGALLVGLIQSPLVVLGSYIGVRLGNLIPIEMLRQIALGLLLLTAILSIVSPLLG